MSTYTTPNNEQVIAYADCWKCDGNGFYESCHKGPRTERYYVKYACESCIERYRLNRNKRLLEEGRKMSEKTLGQAEPVKEKQPLKLPSVEEIIHCIAPETLVFSDEEWRIRCEIKEAVLDLLKEKNNATN